MCAKNVDHQLLQFTQQFEKCYDLLINTVDSYSSTCSRLYMLTPPEVLQLVGQARSLFHIKRLICKCFCDVSDLLLGDGRRIDGLEAPSGESVRFSQSIVATGPTHLWLPQLFTEMQEFVKFDILSALEQLERIWNKTFAVVLKNQSGSGRRGTNAIQASHRTGRRSTQGVGRRTRTMGTSSVETEQQVKLPHDVRFQFISDLNAWMNHHTGQALCSAVQLFWYSNVKTSLGGARTARKKQIQQSLLLWRVFASVLPDLRDGLWTQKNIDYSLSFAKWEAICVTTQAAVDQLQTLVVEKVCSPNLYSFCSIDSRTRVFLMF